MSNFWRTNALLIAAFMLFAEKLPAQNSNEPANQDLTALSLDQLMKIEVQTASLHSQDIASAPGLVTVITAEQIEVNGYRTLGEALNHVMGFYVTYDHTYYSAGVAGFSVPGDWATRILVLVNGHSMTDNIFGSANYFGDDFALDMSLIRRIEIVRGPSSALYGSNGILATINVITRNPDKEHGTTVNMETDSFGEKKVTVTSARHLFRDSSLLVSGSAFNTSGQPDIFVSAWNSPATNNGNVANMDGSRGYRFFTDFKSGNWELLSLTGSREKIQPVSWSDTVFNDRGTRATDQSGFVDLQYTRDTDTRGSIRWRLYYDQYRYHGDYRYPMTDQNGDSGIDVNHEFDAGDWVGTQLTDRFSFLRGYLTAGSEIKFDLRALQSTADIQPVYRQNLYVNKLDKFAAGFLQQEWEVGPHLSLNFGGRYDWSLYRSSSFSPRAAAVFHPNGRNSVKLLYGRGFRNPNANELFFNDGKQNEGNLGLRPETADTFQLEVERKFGHSWKTSVEAYHVVDKGVIIPAYTSDNLIQFQNASRFRGYGVGMEVDGNLLPRLQLSASFQKQKAWLSGEVPANSPGNIGKLQLSSPLPLSHSTISGAFLYMSERTTLAGNRLGPVYLPEATLSARLTAGLSIRAGVRNLTNFKYSDPIGLTNTVDTLPQPGRTLFFTLSSHLPR